MSQSENSNSPNVSTPLFESPIAASMTPTSISSGPGLGSMVVVVNPQANTPPQPIPVIISLVSGKRDWGTRHTQIKLAPALTFSEVLYSLINVSNFLAVKVNGHGKLDQRSVIDGLTASGVLKPNPSDPTNCTAIAHLPVTIEYTLALSLKRCTCVGCEHFFQPRSSRRACDSCSIEGQDVVPSRILSLYVPNGARSLLSVDLTKPVNRTTSQEIYPYEDLEILVIMAKYFHWKFEAGSKVETDPSKQTKDALPLTSDAEGQVIHAVFGSPADTAAIMQEVERLGLDKIPLGNRPILRLARLPESIGSGLLRTISHFWKLQLGKYTFTKMGHKVQTRPSDVPMPSPAITFRSVDSDESKGKSSASSSSRRPKRLKDEADAAGELLSPAVLGSSAFGAAMSVSSFPQQYGMWRPSLPMHQIPRPFTVAPFTVSNPDLTHMNSLDSSLVVPSSDATSSKKQSVAELTKSPAGMSHQSSETDETQTLAVARAPTSSMHSVTSSGSHPDHSPLVKMPASTYMALTQDPAASVKATLTVEQQADLQGVGDNSNLAGMYPGASNMPVILIYRDVRSDGQSYCYTASSAAAPYSIAPSARPDAIQIDSRVETASYSFPHHSSYSQPQQPVLASAPVMSQASGSYPATFPSPQLSMDQQYMQQRYAPFYSSMQTPSAPQQQFMSNAPGQQQQQHLQQQQQQQQHHQQHQQQQQQHSVNGNDYDDASGRKRPRQASGNNGHLPHQEDMYAWSLPADSHHLQPPYSGFNMPSIPSMHSSAMHADASAFGIDHSGDLYHPLQKGNEKSNDGTKGAALSKQEVERAMRHSGWWSWSRVSFNSWVLLVEVMLALLGLVILGKAIHDSSSNSGVVLSYGKHAPDPAVSGGLFTLLQSYNNPVFADSRLVEVDANTKDIVASLAVVSNLFNNFLVVYNITSESESMNFKSDVRRQLLSDRVRETISITYGLGKVMQEFADNVANLAVEENFAQWAINRCNVLDNPIGRAMVLFLCRRKYLRYRPYPPPLASIHHFNDSAACDDILAPDPEDFLSEDVWYGTWRVPPDSYFFAGNGSTNLIDQCTRTVTYVLKYYMFVPTDPLDYIPPESIWQLRLRTQAASMTSTAASMQIPLTMLTILNRDTPTTTEFYSRQWEINGVALLLLVCAVPGVHLLMAVVIWLVRYVFLWLFPYCKTRFSSRGEGEQGSMDNDFDSFGSHVTLRSLKTCA